MNNMMSVLKSMWRNISMTITSLLLVILTLLVVGFVVILSINTHHIAKNVIDNISISTFLEPKISKKEKEQVENEIRNIDGVKKVTLSSKEVELKQVTKNFGNNGDKIYNYFEKNNPLSDVFVVEVKNNVTDFEVINQQIEKIHGVESSTYGEKTETKNFVNSMRMIQIISILVSIILLIISIFIITNTIKLNINARYKEIEIMRLVGATKRYIRLPFIFEGVLIGIIGALISSLFLLGGYYYSITYTLVGAFKDGLVNFRDIINIIFILLPLVGILIGIMGSRIAIRKHLKK